MSAAHDAAQRQLSLHGEPRVGGPCLCDACVCARFVLAVDPANERLVEDVARALADANGTPWDFVVGGADENDPYYRDARAALAVIAQSAGGDRG